MQSGDPRGLMVHTNVYRWDRRQEYCPSNGEYIVMRNNKKLLTVEEPVYERHVRCYELYDRIACEHSEGPR